jgi:hypothetical protein
MPNIEVLKSGHVDRHDSQFPTLVQLDEGDLVCGVRWTRLRIDGF